MCLLCVYRLNVCVKFRFFSEYSGLSLLLSLHQCCMLHVTLILLVPEAQRSKTNERANKDIIFGY